MIKNKILIITILIVLMPQVFSSDCSVSPYGFADSARFQNTPTDIGFVCSNNASIASCWYSINRFHTEYESNCSRLNMTLQLGRNDVVVWMNNGSNASGEYTIYVSSQAASIWDLTLLWVSILVYAFMLWIGVKSGYGVFYLLSCIPAFFLGLEVMTFSVTAGAFSMIMLMGTSFLLLALK